MRAKDIMTKDVVTVSPEADIATITNLFLKKHIGAAPVVQADGQILGVVSDTDLAARVAGWPLPHQSFWALCFQSPAKLSANIRKIIGQTARDIMTTPAVVIREDMAVQEIAELMAGRHLRRVPVARDGKLVGIVSRADLVRVLALSGATEGVASSLDHEIRERVLKETRARRPSGSHRISAVVFDGTIHLWGVVDTAEEREANQLVAESVLGVRHVKNHLSVFDASPSDIATVI